MTTVHSRVLARLVDLLGSRQELGRRLEVPSTELLRWLAGIAPMPTPIFLKAVDLLVNEARTLGELQSTHQAPSEVLSPDARAFAPEIGR